MTASQGFRKVIGNNVSDTISSSIASGASSIPVNAISKWGTGIGKIIVDRGTAAEEIFLGTGISGSSITVDTNATTYKEGTSQTGHDAGASIESVPTAGDANDAYDAWVTEHNAAGTHKSALVTTLKATASEVATGTDDTKIVTPKAIKDATLTLTTPKVVTSINDANGNEVIKTPATASAVNEVTVTNSATGNAVQVSATGDDTNIDLKLVAKGTGAILDKNGEALSPNQSLFSQLVRNPNMDVWQRGTTFNNLGAAKYTADGWFLDSIGATYTISQQDGTGVAGSQYCMRLARNAGSTATDAWVLRQACETKDAIKYRGKKATLSFWARAGANFSPTGSSITAEIRSTTSSDQAPNFSGSSLITAAKTLTTTWQRFSITTTDVIASNVNQLGLDIFATPTGTAGAADYFEITQLKLNAGDVALPFQPKSFAQELLDCMRYYYRFTALSAYGAHYVGQCISTTQAKISVIFPTQMRIAPTIDNSAANTWQLSTANGGGAALTNLGLADNQPDQYQLLATVASGLTAGHATFLLGNNNAAAYIGFSAEL